MEWLKITHMGCVGMSFALFLLRGYWMYWSLPYLQHKLWARRLPDSIDTVLLGTGITMMFQYDIFPNEQPWLAVKILALLAYIGLGAVALHRGKSIKIRLSCYIAAIIVFFYMVIVAVSKDIWPLPI
ncbi:MAG: SirB2 family protein [Mariprofundaceae bacterium]